MVQACTANESSCRVNRDKPEWQADRQGTELGLLEIFKY